MVMELIIITVMIEIFWINAWRHILDLIEDNRKEH